MGRKVAYHGIPCFWEHENALQRSQGKKTNKICEDRPKRWWKTVVEKPPLRVSQICAYARSIEARVSQICAYARDRVKVTSMLSILQLAHSTFRYVVMGANARRCSQTQNEIIASKTELPVKNI